MTYKVIRFSDAGFTPSLPTYIKEDAIEPGVFAFSLHSEAIVYENVIDMIDEILH